jgi:hypothetical protein
MPEADRVSRATLRIKTTTCDDDSLAGGLTATRNIQYSLTKIH